MNISHFWKRKILCSAIVALLSLGFLSAQPVNIVTADSLPSGIAILNFECFVDQTGTMPFDAIKEQPFLPLTDSFFAIPPFYAGWTRFRLQNIAQGSSMSGVIKFDGHIDWMHVWQGDSVAFMEYKSGNRFNCDQISLSDLDDCIPFTLQGGETKLVYAKLRIHDGKVLETPFVHLKVNQQVKDEAKNANDLSRISLFKREIFAQVILLILVMVIIFWIFIREKILVWYIAHLVAVWGYFSMNVGVVKYFRHIFCGWREWTLPIQIMATYAVLICYISFSRVLLDIKIENNELDRFVGNTLRLVLTIALIQAGILCFFPLQSAFEFYNIGRFICLPIWLGLTLFYVFALTGGLRWLVIVGSIAKMLPAFFVLVHHVLPGKYRYEIDNIWRVIDTKYGTYGMYTIQIGILIEVLCFVIAIAFKIRAEKQRRDKLVLRVAMQMLQIDDLSTEMKTVQVLKSVLLKIADTDEKKQSEFLKRVHVIVEIKLSDPTFGVEQLADEIPISRTQLHRKIRAETGDSTSQLILSVRLARATKLLQSTDQTVAEISRDCGFSEPNYFSKVFKKCFNVTPTEFREKRF